MIASSDHRANGGRPRRGRLAGLAAALVTPAALTTAVAAPPQAPPDRPRETRAAASGAPTPPVRLTPPVVPPAPREFAADLTTALRLAEVENPEIAAARMRILE